MLVFREIEEMVQEVKGKLATLGDESDLSIEERRLQLLLRLISYVNRYEWLSHKKTREKIACFLKNRYNYRAVADRFGLPLSRVHKTVSYASERLRRRIGGVLALIRSGQLDDAERELALVTGAVDSSSLFVRGILERFKPVKDTRVDLADCHREISFLSYFTNRNIDRVLSKIDSKKLNHVLYVLLKSDATYPERSILARCILDGEFDASEAIKRINDEFIYSASSERHS